MTYFLNLTLFFYLENRLVLVRHSHLILDVAGAIAGAENLTKYDSVDADVIQSYSEYSLASLLYYAMKVGT
jgi:F-type H+-transporting ATPase subunit gamma